MTSADEMQDEPEAEKRRSAARGHAVITTLRAEHRPELRVGEGLVEELPERLRRELGDRRQAADLRPLGRLGPEHGRKRVHDLEALLDVGAIRREEVDQVLLAPATSAIRCCLA